MPKRDGGHEQGKADSMGLAGQARQLGEGIVDGLGGPITAGALQIVVGKREGCQAALLGPPSRGQNLLVVPSRL